MKAANYLGEKLGIPVYQVKPIKELNTKGFYKFIWGGRQVVFGTKPDIEPLGFSLEEVDLIILGSPVWAGTFAPPIKTFLEDGFVKNKKIAYFYTHEGGAKKAGVHGKKAIEKYNTFLGDISLFNVIKGDTSWQEAFFSWGKEIVKKI